MYKILIGLAVVQIGIAISNLLRTNKVMDKFQPLMDEVAQLKSVNESAIALITGLAERLDEAKDDPEQIAALVSELRSSREGLASAVAANTPSEEPSTPVEPTEPEVPGETGNEETPGGETPTEEEPTAPGEETAGGPTSTDQA